MSRSAPYIEIIAALITSALLITFSGVVTTFSPNHPVTTSTSTLSVVPSFTLPIITLPDLVSRATVAIPAKPAPTHPSRASVLENATSDEPLSAVRASLVNIICSAPKGSGLHSISGSGVIIDSKGIILTNAHIAQYFLLANRSVSCTIRTGSPATTNYTATLIYISPAWLRANPDVLTETLPIGTGEYDFALLAISQSATAKPLPSSFPHIPLATTPPAAGAPVIIASYGAQSLGSNQIQSALFPTIVLGSVKEVLTFRVNTVDVLALGGSAAAQEGSSGGGVTDASDNLLGILTTSTVEGDTSTRPLHAITVSYIRREYKSETGQELDLLLAEATSTTVTDFAHQMPALEAIVTANLP